jgi:hypothetical protein
MQRKDLYWKAFLHETLFELFEYQYPDTFAELDLTREPEFLEKELRRIASRGKQKGRVVDVLARVWKKNGEEKWILIYIEVQGYWDNFFDKRMFTGQYRIFEIYDQLAISLAIFTDSNPNWHPKNFILKNEATEIRYSFDSIKLIKETPETLQKGQNPIGIALTIAWYALQKFQFDDTRMMEIKREILRDLRKADFSPAKIRAIFNFVVEYQPFDNKEKQTIFAAEEFDKILNEPPMLTLNELGMRDRANRAELVLRQVTKKLGIAEKKAIAAEKFAEKAEKAAIKAEKDAVKAERDAVKAERDAEKTAEKAAEKAAKMAHEKINIQHITNMLKKNYEPTIIVDLLEVPLKKVLAIQKQLNLNN